MDIILNQVKAIKLRDEIGGVRVITFETKKGDYLIYLRKSDTVKRLAVKRERA